MHKRRGSKHNEFSCRRGDCLSGFPRIGLLEKHLRLHDNDLIRCSFCPWGTNDYKEKIIHLNHHFNLRPHKCDFCEKKFFLAATKRQHEEAFHEKILDRYKCTLCDFTTHASYILSRHKHVHY